MHWLIEMNVLLAVFAVIYLLAFRKDKLFHFNRAYLLAALALSAIVPHLTFQVGSGSPMQSFVVSLPAITVGGEAANASGHAAPAAGISIVDILLWVWIAGMASMTIRFAWRWLKLALYIRKNYSHTQSGIRWVTHDGPICIAGPYLLAPKAWHDQTEHPVIQHELVHLRQGHTLDVILGEVLTIVCWFNPLAYQLKKALREVHEYLADDAVMQQHDIDRGAYCQWIIQLATRPNTLTLAHTFSPSPIKNRLAMLHEQTHWKAALLKRALLLPLVAITLTFAACKKDSSTPVYSEQEAPIDSTKFEALKEEFRPIAKQLIDMRRSEKIGLPYRLFDEGEVLEVAEVMPEYPGGTEALYQDLKQNLKYPEGIENEEMVTAMVRFVVDKDGTPTNFEVLNAGKIPPAFVKEAIRGATAMGKWKPGRQNGEPVAVRYFLPIRFAPPTE